MNDRGHVTEKNDRGWPRAGFSHSNGQSECGLDLYLKLDRPITERDREVIDRAMSGMHRDLLAESTRLHPDNVAWKAQWLLDARSMFLAAGLSPIYVREIDNKYCGPQCCPHRVWLLVTTPIGVFEVGWRKRVLQIDWSATDVAARAADLFPDEDVTKGDRSIHAWGYDKAMAYIAKIAVAKGP